MGDIEMTDPGEGKTEKGHEKDHSETIAMVTMNLSGRFKGKEIKRYGQDILKYILVNKEITVFFGQQMNFRPSMPDNFTFEGGSRAFIYYDRKVFRGCDEKQYRHYLKDMENQGRIKRYYLPEANYVCLKLRSRATPRNKFLAISWMTDECQGKLKSLNLVRKLLSFAADLCTIEEMPVVIGGTFRITLEEAKNIVYTEFEGFRVYGYMATRPKRILRMSNFYFTAKPVRMDEVKPLICSKLDVACDMSERWLNPEDAFYWDPVITKTKLRRYHHHHRPPSPPKANLDANALAAHVARQPGSRVRGEWSKLEPTLEKKEPSVASDTWSDFTEMERRMKQEEDDEKSKMKSAQSAPTLAFLQKSEPDIARQPSPEPVLSLAPMAEPPTKHESVPDFHAPLDLPAKHERTMQSVPDLDDPTVFAKLEDTLRRIENRRAQRKPDPNSQNMAATSAAIQETLKQRFSPEDAEVSDISKNGRHPENLKPKEYGQDGKHQPENDEKHQPIVAEEAPITKVSTNGFTPVPQYADYDATDAIPYTTTINDHGVQEEPLIEPTNVGRLGADTPTNQSRAKTPQGFFNPDEYDLSVEVSRKEERVPGFDTFGLKMQLTKQEELDIELADATHLLQSITSDRTADGRTAVSQPNLSFGHTFSHENLHSRDYESDDGTGEVPMNGILRKIPSYIELYDEELLESNTLCYMQ